MLWLVTFYTIHVATQQSATASEDVVSISGAGGSACVTTPPEGSANAGFSMLQRLQSVAPTATVAASLATSFTSAGSKAAPAVGSAIGRAAVPVPTGALPSAPVASTYPQPRPENYAEAYNDLYENYSYHSNSNYSLEGPVIEQLLEFTKALASNSPSLRSVVVLGCSHGKGAEQLHQYGFDAFGIDVARAAIQQAKALRGNTCSKPPCFVQGSLTSLPYQNYSMDAGLSADVLEHIARKDVPQVVSEISRVVKHYLVLQIAAFSEHGHNGEKAGMGNLHLTVEDAPWWIQQFSAKGWKVVVDSSLAGYYVRLLMQK
jgi:hypothetical protein